jgi:hypothetical protein
MTDQYCPYTLFPFCSVSLISQHFSESILVGMGKYRNSLFKMRYVNIISFIVEWLHYRGRHDVNHMVVGFTTTYAISAYHH